MTDRDAEFIRRRSGASAVRIVEHTEERSPEQVGPPDINALGIQAAFNGKHLYVWMEPFPLRPGWRERAATGLERMAKERA